MKNFVFIILTIFTSSSVLAYSVDDVLNKAKSKLEGSVSYDCTYTLFKGYSDNQIHTEYYGFSHRINENVYQKVNSNELVQTSEFALQVKQEEKSITISNPTESKEQNFDLNVLLSDVDHKTISENEDGFFIEIFYLASSSTPISKISLAISTSFDINEMELFYRNAHNFSKDPQSVEYSLPRLRIKFTNISHKATFTHEYFSKENYLKEGIEPLQPSLKYVGYTIIDRRTKH